MSIKNVPERIVEQLRERAARHHRSMQGELMTLICEAVAPDAGAGDAPEARRSGSRTIEEIAAEHRAKWPEPLDPEPRAVDVIRADRDAR